MSMANCPYCSEQIQETASKCKHCGEWLDPAKRPAGVMAPSSAERDYSNFHKFTYNSSVGAGYVFAVDEESARAQIDEVAKGAEVSRIKLAKRGQVSCPNCGNQYTACHKDFGCVFFIIVFVSLGLG